MLLRDLPLLGLGHLFLGVMLSVDILLHKHKPVSAVLWLGVVWGFPLIGALAYVGFGVDRVRRGGAEREASRRLIARRAALHPTFERLSLSPSHSNLPAEERHPAEHILRATDPAVPLSRVTKGNCARLLVDGDEFYPALFRAVERAESSIHLQTFIFRRDRIGGELREVLIEKAHKGVTVRLLYDRFGSTFAHYSNFFTPAREAGVQVSSISQANPLKGRFQINLRNHRKIAVVDGKIGFVGGINIHDGNYSAYARRDVVRDYHVEVVGPSVMDLQLQFIEDWHFATREDPDRLMELKYFPHIDPQGSALVQIVPGGPDPMGYQLSDAIFAAVVSARECIDIVTPYFVPDEPIIHALRYAAQRGVAVRLVLPRRSNHWYTTYAARSLYTPLMSAGVEIFERRPPFIHAKALAVDRVYAMLGSANLDYRSLHLNFETNLEVIDDDFVASVLEQIESEIALSVRVSLAEHRQRPLVKRLAENFCHLFQPML